MSRSDVPKVFMYICTETCLLDRMCGIARDPCTRLYSRGKFTLPQDEPLRDWRSVVVQRARPYHYELEHTYMCHYDSIRRVDIEWLCFSMI